MSLRTIIHAPMIGLVSLAEALMAIADVLLRAAAALERGTR